MKTILLPTDFSENAWNAMQYAARLFENETCKYILLNTYHVVLGAVDMVDVPHVEFLMEVSEDGLASTLKKFEELSHHSNTWFETMSGQGEVSIEVERIAKENDVDIVVMGTKGASNTIDILMGSVTYAVVKRVSIPVLCIPEKSTFTTPQKIVFATDNQHIEDIDVLQPLKEIAKQNKSSLAILNIQDQAPALVPVEEAEESFALHEYFTKVSHDFYFRNSKNIENAIQDFAHDKEADMIVMLKRKRTIWEELFSSRNTKKMAFHTDIPLLILHD